MRDCVDLRIVIAFLLFASPSRPLMIDTDCVIAGETAPCMAPPTEAIMLFNGGGCEQSDNNQGVLFTCEDLGPGVPTELGDEVHIRVTDINGNGIVYFDGIVRVGDFYLLNDGGERFDTNQFITVSSPASPVQRLVLQEVQYHTSCSSNLLELKNRFGSSQLVAFFNEKQGNVTCFNVLKAPSESPSMSPSQEPSLSPSAYPSQLPSTGPSQEPSLSPSANPSELPSASPREGPSLSAAPSEPPSTGPSQEEPQGGCDINIPIIGLIICWILTLLLSIFK